MDRFDPGTSIQIQTLTRCPPDLFICGADVQNPARDRLIENLGHVEDRAYILSQLAKSFFAISESFLGALSPFQFKHHVDYENGQDGNNREVSQYKYFLFLFPRCYS